MKRLLKFVAVFFLLCVLASFVRYALLTPEQRAAERAEREKQEKVQAEKKAFAQEVKKLQDAIIADEKPKFLAWLTNEGGCTMARFTEDHTLEVAMPRLLIPTKDDARVRGEEIAEKWAMKGGGDRVVVTVYYGNEPYAEGVYAGGTHPIFTIKVNALGTLIDKAKAEKAAKEKENLKGL